MERLFAGRYRMEGVLGRGGMAEVHAAIDERLGREVAVKLVSIDGTTVEARQRFVREARAIAGFSHPNVVTLYDAGEADGFLFLVMERVSGITLAAALADGPLAVATATSLAVQLLSALDATHHAGIVHRDVKPANLLLDAAGQLKLVDFGIALGLGEVAGDLTGTDQHIGTPKYMAPELLTGGSPTPASDVYAVGVVLYEMLTGRPPFDAGTPIATAMAHVNEPVPDVAGRRPEIPARLVAAVTTALSKDPDDRYSTADAMRRVLDPLVPPGPAPVAEPTHVMTPGSLPPGRHRTSRTWLVAAVAAVLVGLVAAVAVTRSGDGDDTSGAASASSPSPASEAAVAPTPASAATTVAPTTAVPPTTAAVPPTTAGPGLDQAETPGDVIAVLTASDRYGARATDVVSALERLGNGRKATDRALALLDDAARWVADGELAPEVLGSLQTVLEPIADGPGNGNGNGNRGDDRDDDD